MNAFAAAVATIFRDPNMSRAALYRSGGEGDGVPVRVMMRAPDASVSFGEASLVTESQSLDVQVSDVPSLAQGDTFELDDGTMLKVRGDPTRDRERLCWSAGVQEL